MKYIILIYLLMVTQAETKLLNVTSSAFPNKSSIPQKYSCEGENINPPLEINVIPKGTKSLVLIIEDPDAKGGTFVHWVLWNIEPAYTIAENSAPGIQGENSSGTNMYIGPCPPEGKHRYYFRVYALDEMLDLDRSSDKDAVRDAMVKHILAEGTLIGDYEKKNN